MVECLLVMIGLVNIQQETPQMSVVYEWLILVYWLLYSKKHPKYKGFMNG